MFGKKTIRKIETLQEIAERLTERVDALDKGVGLADANTIKFIDGAITACRHDISASHQIFGDEFAGLRKEIKFTNRNYFGPSPHVAISSRNPTVYVLIALNFNHIRRNVPIDRRFNSNKNYVFYFFDQEAIDLSNFPMRRLEEKWIYPMVASAGRSHLAEWAFFLAEYHKKFLNYPFYAVSSRFYEKNNRLAGSLDDYWDAMFCGLEKYGFGYLPSYDRDFSFIDMVEYYDDPERNIGTTVEGIDYIKDRFSIDMRTDYNKISDYWCNYIGFNSRKNFENYMEFYMPIFNEFFDEDYKLKKDYMKMKLVRPAMNFREYKPLTLLLEQISHLYFYSKNIPFFGLHYDGMLEVREREGKFCRQSAR